MGKWVGGGDDDLKKKEDLLAIMLTSVGCAGLNMLM